MPNENNLKKFRENNVEVLNEKKPNSKKNLELYEPTKTIEIIERVTSVDHDSLYKVPVPAEYDNNLSRNLDATNLHIT